MQKWKEVVKVIRRTNGLEFEMNHGEVAFREEIVETVWKQVKTELVWDDTHVQGKGRMQEVIKEVSVCTLSSASPKCYNLYVVVYIHVFEAKVE